MKQLRNHYSHRSGASVVEVIVALSLTGLLLVSVTTLLGSLERLKATSQFRERALAYAKESLENSQTVPFSNLVSTSENLHDGQMENREVVVTPLCRDANQMLADCATGTNTGDAKKITVTVNWKEHAQPKSLSLFATRINWQTP